MSTMNVKELKKLYSLDKDLAVEVASVLGFKIKTKTKKGTKAENVPAPKAPSTEKLKRDITNMLQKELNTMKLGKDMTLWIEQLPDFLN